MKLRTLAIASLLLATSALSVSADESAHGSLTGEGTFTLTANGQSSNVGDFMTLTLSWEIVDDAISFSYTALTKNPTNTVRVTRIDCVSGVGTMDNPSMGSRLVSVPWPQQTPQQARDIVENQLRQLGLDGPYETPYLYGNAQSLQTCGVARFVPASTGTSGEPVPASIVLVGAGRQCDVTGLVCGTFSLSGFFTVLTLAPVGPVPWTVGGAIGTLLGYGYGYGIGEWSWRNTYLFEVAGHTVEPTPPGTPRPNALPCFDFVGCPMNLLPPEVQSKVLAQASYAYYSYLKAGSVVERVSYYYEDGLHPQPGAAPISTGTINEVRCTNGRGHAAVGVVAYTGTCGLTHPTLCTEAPALYARLDFDGAAIDTDDAHVLTSGRNVLRASNANFNATGALSC